MARILYGVHGTQHGHAIRALILARHLAALGHEFRFVSSEEGAGLLEREFQVHRFENPGTRYKNQRLDTPATLKLAARTLAKRGSELSRLDKLIKDFRPDAAISDYEYFVPIAAKRAGIPCLSIDHQHVISCCAHDVPARFWPDYLGIRASIRFLFSACSDYLAISFFQPPPKPGARARVVPAILRRSVIERTPTHGSHIVVYQSCGICDAFAPYLKTMDREFRVYGYKMDKVDGNLTFRNYSEDGFLDDLASCAYVICGGSHNLMSEALFFGKPVLSFPVAGAFEQQLNALYLKRLGYGRAADMSHLSPTLLPDFENNLDRMRQNIATGHFCGNEQVFALVGAFLRDGRLPGRS
jgi:uncharacterized protein (TIGR00661 family)